MIPRLRLIIPYCGIGADGEGPAADDHFRQVFVVLRLGAVDPYDVKFDQGVAFQRDGYVQVVVHILALGTATTINNRDRHENKSKLLV